MKPGAPWSIKGIDPQAREAAKVAAAKVGMTLGEFFNHLLLEADPSGIASGETPQAGASKRMSASSAEPDLASSAQAGVVRELAEKLKNSETQTAKDISDIRQNVTELSGKMTSLADLAGQAGVNPEINPNALEDLNHRIEENQRLNDKAIADTQNTLSEISERIESSISRSNEAVTTVGQAIEVMAGRLDSLENKSDEVAGSPVLDDPIDESMQFGLQNEPESDLAEPKASELFEDPLSDLEEISAPDEETLETIVQDLEGPLLDTKEEKNEIFSASDEDTQTSEQDLASEGLVSEEEPISKVDEEVAEAGQPDGLEPDLKAFEDILAGTDPAAETGAEEMEAALFESSPGSSVDEFLNQFGDETLIIREQDDETEDTANLTDKTTEMPLDLSHTAGLQQAEPETLDDSSDTEGKSAQDVIDAIRRAARSTSEGDAFADQTGEDDDDRMPADAVAGYRAKTKGGSSRVKYAIYAACSAILLAASGLIASVKGLI